MCKNGRSFTTGIYDCKVKAQDGSEISLAENTTFEGFGASPMTLLLKGIVKKMDKDDKNNGNINCNFTKFLMDRGGEIAARFEPTAAMKDVKAKVEEVL